MKFHYWLAIILRLEYLAEHLSFIHNIAVEFEAINLLFNNNDFVFFLFTPLYHMITPPEMKPKTFIKILELTTKVSKLNYYIMIYRYNGFSGGSQILLFYCLITDLGTLYYYFHFPRVMRCLPRKCIFWDLLNPLNSFFFFIYLSRQKYT